MFRIVLIEPEIPQNTGNIARLCASAGVELVLVGKLGFSLDDKYLKRSGMDYWQYVKLTRFLCVEDYLSENPVFVGVSTKGTKRYTEINFHEVFYDVVFGCESSGLPEFFYEQYFEKLYRIPMREGFRSLNLSSSAAIIAYFLLEKHNFSGLV